ncbi:chalcone isomerase family protein [Guyparkeria sp. 1SP6A2]|nr:chalcone isomerase family protein [Guyparkeria sp. 1SP6A2]
MTRLALALAACLAWGATLPVAAAEFEPEVSLSDTPLVLQGYGTASYLFWDVYDAALYAPPGAGAAAIASAKVPMSLVLAYHRPVAVEDIRKATWTALDRQFDAAERRAIRPKIDAIQNAMVDVGEGDRYRLDWQPERRRLVLYLNGVTRFESDDADLARAYFGIWLGEPPLSSKLRQALLSKRD